MTAKATRKAELQQATPSIESLRRFTPEQLVELGLTTYTVATLKKLAQRHRVRHHREGAVATGRIYFTLADIEANTRAEQFEPLSA